jgi:hypothetical protein
MLNVRSWHDATTPADGDTAVREILARPTHGLVGMSVVVKGFGCRPHGAALWGFEWGSRAIAVTADRADTRPRPKPEAAPARGYAMLRLTINRA